MVSEQNRWLPHPLSGSSLRNLLRVLARHGLHIEPRRWPRFLTAAAAVTAATPLRLWEQHRHGSAIAQQTIDQPPIMILGHWRSGTTNLHNLLLCDKRFASVSLLHCSIPHLHLTLGNTIGRFVQRRLGKTRPMDAVPLGIHEPMSEDFGLVGRSDQTHYGSYFFPQHAEAEFRRTVLFDGPNANKAIANWERDYTQLLQNVTYESGGKRLCLKNPPNTGRVRHVLKLFPDAKFIFVRRNPYLVHASTCRLMERFLDQFALQRWDREHIENFVSLRYEQLMQKWFADRDAIPDQNLIELSHEEITASPIGVIESIYSKLNLPGFDDIQPALQQRVRGDADYRNNKYRFDDAYLARIEPHIARTAKLWNYSRPNQRPNRPPPNLCRAPATK